MSKRRSIRSIPLPIDCIGEINLFNNSTEVLLCLLQLSKHVIYYLSEEFPRSSKNIRFNIVKDMDFNWKLEYKYVINLLVHDKAVQSLIRFPNLETLKVVRYSLKNDPIQEKQITELYELKYLTDVTFRGITGKSLTEMSFKGFSRVKKLDIRHSGFQESGVRFLTSCTDLKLGFVEFPNKLELLPSTLKMLNIRNSLVSTKSIEHLTNLENLDISWTYNLDETVLKSKYKIRKLNILYSALMDSFHKIDFKKFDLLELRLGGNTEINEKYLVNFPNLEKLSFFDCSISGECLKELKNIKDLQVGTGWNFNYKNLQHLTKLEKIGVCSISGLKYLLNSENIKSLEIGSFGSHNFGEEFYQIFSGSSFSSLEILKISFISGTESDFSMELISCCFIKLRKLRLLDISNWDEITVVLSDIGKNCSSIRKLKLNGLEKIRGEFLQSFPEIICLELSGLSLNYKNFRFLKELKSLKLYDCENTEGEGVNNLTLADGVKLDKLTVEGVDIEKIEEKLRHIVKKNGILKCDSEMFNSFL